MIDRYKFEWPFQGCVPHRKLWRLHSVATQALAFGLAKVWTSWPFNNKVLHNGKSFRTFMEERQMQIKRNGGTNRALLTISNHKSCLDDPLLWGALLSWKQLASGNMRWVPVAAEICFTNRLYSFLFGRGHCVPVVRGHGVYQQGVDFCVKRLSEGQWVHIFPEGKINLDGARRLKWGVGRMIAESDIIPDVIPIWLMGSDHILPNQTPYIPRIRKTMAIYIGQPLGLESLVSEWKEQIADPMALRKKITDYVEAEFWSLKEKAITHHQKVAGGIDKFSEH